MLICLIKYHYLKQVSPKLFSKLGRCLSTVSSRDFFGIFDVTSKDIAGALSTSKPQLKEIEEKYRFLTVSRNQPANEETKHDAVFGEMRFDRENIPKKHGQYEPTNESRMFETTDIKESYIRSNSESINDKVETNNSKEDTCIGNAPYKMAEVSQEMSFLEALRLFKKINPVEDIEKYSNQPPLAFHFEFTTTNEIVDDNHVATPIVPDELPRTKSHSSCKQVAKNEPQPKVERGSSFEQPIDDRMKEFMAKKSRKIVMEPDTEEPEPFSEKFYEAREKDLKDFEFNKKLDEKYDHDTENPKPKLRAIDHIKMVRAKRVEPSDKKLKQRLEDGRAYSFKPLIKLDSQGFNDYTYQVPSFMSSRHIEIQNYIKDSVIYNNYDILAINKPYGIASHDSEKSREPFDMNSLVGEIAAQLKIEKVYLAHRLDKTTTGVLLFATSKRRAMRLNKQFKSDEIKKTYWCITRGVPDPEQAILDIPIGEYVVAGRVRSCLAPEDVSERKQLSKKFREARRAITEYKVLKATRYAALVECKPRSGVKHQIRCHMSFGLNRPILGDHKYSHIAKLAPQTLPIALLNAFHVRQEKVRTLPMHLHAKTIVIPGAKANGETLFIHAPLPLHFKNNLKTLKLMDDEIKEMAR